MGRSAVDELLGIGDVEEEYEDEEECTCADDELLDERDNGVEEQEVECKCNCTCRGRGEPRGRYDDDEDNLFVSPRKTNSKASRYVKNMLDMDLGF